MSKPKYSAEFKIEVAKAYLNGEGILLDIKKE
jgi:transposase-like protein